VESELLGEDVSSQLGDNEEQDEVDPLRDLEASSWLLY